MADDLSEPRLRIETGAHLGRVLAFDVDGAGTLLLTAGEDNTARLWSAPTLRPLGVLRPRLATDPYQQLWAAALSTDGSMGAVGGYSDGPLNIAVFDVARCEIVWQVSVPEVSKDTVRALRFSPDGTLLTIGTEQSGLVVFDVADWLVVGHDNTIEKRVSSLDFSSDGQTLAAACEDGVIRLYEAKDLRGDMVPARQAPALEGLRANCVSFSPDGSELAIGFEEGGIELRAARDLSLSWHRSPEGYYPNSDFSVVAWRRDGKSLLVSGNTCQTNYEWVAMNADAVNGGTDDWRVATREPMRANVGFMADLEVGLVIVSRAGEIALYDADGVRREHLLPPNGDPRTDFDLKTADGHTFRASLDGTVAEWTFAPFWRAVRFDAQRLTLESQPLPPRAGLASWTAARGKHPLVEGWLESNVPKLRNGRELALQRGDVCHAVDVGRGHVLLGGTFNLYRFSAVDGSPAAVKHIVAGAYRVKQSTNGKLAIAALLDGTVRWYRLDDTLEELLAVFVTDEPSPRWVAFMPDGYYAAGAGAEHLIGWDLNRGPDRSAHFLPVSNYRGQFHRPDVVKRVLITLDAKEALRQADEACGSQPTPPPEVQIAKVREDQPPIVNILAPREGALLPADGEVVIAAEVRIPATKRVQEVLVRVDGGSALYIPVASPLQLANPAPGENASLRLLQITLGAEPRQQAMVEIFALDDNKCAGPAASVTLKRPPALQIMAGQATKPRLLAVLLGVTNYNDRSLRKAVAFASKDARDLTAKLQLQGGVLYREVICRRLPENITRNEVFDALTWLEKESTGLDTALLFLAGHGMTWLRSTYYFLLADATLQAPEKYGLSGPELVTRMDSVGAKRLVMLDTCYAGAAGQRPPDWAPDVDRVMNDLRSVGVPVFGATAANARAQERTSLGNGVFTHALLKVLARPDRPLSHSELWTKLRKEVEVTTDKQQGVSFLNAGSGADLALLAGVDDEGR